MDNYYKLWDASLLLQKEENGTNSNDTIVSHIWREVLS
jgi:hypothetical protein